MLRRRQIYTKRDIRGFLGLAFHLYGNGTNNNRFKIVTLFLATFRHIVLPRFHRRLTMRGKLRALHHRHANPLATPIVHPLFTPRMGGTILDFWNDRHVTATSTLSFPNRPNVVTFTAVLRYHILQRLALGDRPRLK